MPKGTRCKKGKMKEFTREELQNIREKAVDNAESVANNHWKRAYKQLADAVDRLDAMEARTEVLADEAK